MSAAPPLRVTHVVFDVDGTLVDFERALVAALEATASHLSGITGTLVSPAMLRRIREQVAVEPGWRGAGLRMVREESLRRVLRAASIEGEAAVLKASRLYYRARDGALQAYDDAAPTLAALHERGFTLVGASNGNAELGALPLRRWLSDLHHAERSGVSKPDPQFFRLVLERAGGVPGLAVSVGDRLENDYAPARALGMHAILVDREDRVQDPAVLRIRSLGELPAMLEPAGAARVPSRT